MKERLFIVLLIVLVVGCLFTPFFSLYTSTSLPAEVAEAMPESMTGWDVVLKGTSALPVKEMSSLGALSLQPALLIAAVLCTVAGGILLLLRKRPHAYIGLLLSAVGFMLWLSYAFYLQQVSSSLLFSVLISLKWTLWLGVVGAAALLLIGIFQVRKLPAPAIAEGKWRVISAILAIAAVLMIFLPFTTVNVPDGTFTTAAEDSLVRSTRSGLQVLTGQEPLLSTIGSESDAFGSVTTEGGIAELLTLGGTSNAVSNLFKIPTQNPTEYSTLWLGLACLLLGFILQWIRKIDKWIPTAILVLGAILTTMSALMMLMIDLSAAQFEGLTAQMMALGFGHITPIPLLLALVSIAAAGASILGIAYSDKPYFVNPIGQNVQMRVTAVALLVVTLALLCTPIFTAGVYAPGKVNPQNPATSRTFSALELMFFSGDETLVSPVDRRGNNVYGEEPATENGYTASDVSSTVYSGLRRVGVTLIFAAALLLLCIALLILRKGDRKLIITLELIGTALIGVSYLLSTGAIPKDMGTLAAQIPLFAALATGAFSAFFTGFVNYRELPKKYKLFLMILPFLAFVFVFSYLPLAGWRYAFYNYKLGLPMDQQEYVGLKWFQQIVSSPAQRTEIIRVLKNTFGMSGLGLATSWMPVAFAILLSEIHTKWFKKFAQIFTTLPNFISWVLVFSFALTIFSLDTGVFNRVLLDLGWIDEPVAWLNSGEHMWIKMWAWNTWKGLGWGAIMYLAAIAGIDQELYEAARVDGAGRFRQILHITIPGILPTFFVLLLLSISNIINNGMEQYLVFQNSMNKATIEVLDLYVYNISIGSRSSTTISLATAIGILKSIVSIVLLFLANSFSKLVRGESIV